MDEEKDIENLTRHELEEEYKYMQNKCKQLREATEEDAQRIHELKRNLETAIAAEQYLSQELELLTATTGDASTTSSHIKLQTDYDELRKKHAELGTEYNTLQEDYVSLSSEHTKLQNKLEQLHAQNEKNEQSEMQADYDKLVERLQVLEMDNMELLQKLDEQSADTIKQSMLLAEKEKQIEIIKDEVMCLEENMRYKREEIEEKTHLLESAQEQLFEANGKISMLMSAPENKDRKGNSLFAEVDDQRQAMKKVLAAQQKNYLEMKKTYNESQYEIRRLKRENSAMHTELQACSIIFRNADRTYQEKQSARIRYLVDEKEALEKKLKRSQENLTALAKDRGVPWLDSMLNFCKQETENLKEKLYSVRIENASLEEQLRNVRQEMARWRFESLKSRCLLIDRENLLTENKIAFKPQNSIEYDITEEELKNARPRIVPVESRKSIENLENLPTNLPSTPNNLKAEQATSPQQSESNEKSLQAEETTNLQDIQSKQVTAFTNNIKLETSSNNFSNSKISINDSIDCNDKENLKPATEQSPTFEKTNINTTSQQTKSPHLQIKTVETLNMELQQQKNSKSTSRPSILCKDRDIFTEDANEKKVKFAAIEATVHNLSASPNISVLESKNDNSIDGERNEMKPNLNSATTTVKTVRTKSSVVVRRIVVKSKPK